MFKYEEIVLERVSFSVGRVGNGKQGLHPGEGRALSSISRLTGESILLRVWGNRALRSQIIHLPNKYSLILLSEAWRIGVGGWFAEAFPPKWSTQAEKLLGF